MGDDGGIDAEKLEQKIAELNRRLKEQPEDKQLAKAVKVMEKDYLPRQKRYEEQERKLAGRSSYSKTDEDATLFRMKEDRGAEKTLPKPAYNVQNGTEGQFVVGFSLHQRAGGTTCLISHLEGVKANLSAIARRKPELLPQQDDHQPCCLPKNISADAGYGSEENYAYFEDHHLGNTENGYWTELRHYEATACDTCPFKPECTSGKGNRHMRVSFRLRRYREQCKTFRVLRNVEIESVFGQIKHNMRFRSFSLRGLEKVKTEWGLVCIADNMRKLAG